MRAILPIIAILLFGYGTPDAFSQTNYDEVFDGDQVRPHYQKYWDIYSRLNHEQKEKFVERSVKDFQGDNALLPIPRVLSAADGNILKQGVNQRARALQEFLKDYYSGKKIYASEGLIPEAVVQAALDRSLEKGLPNFSDSYGFNFWYGPDIIRDAAGTFRVVEDNLGFIGGMGDLLKARESLVKNIPEYKELADKTLNPDPFYKQIADRYLQMASENQGLALLISYHPLSSTDNEDARLREIFEKNGIENFILQGTNNSRDKKLLFKKDGLFLRVRLPDGTHQIKKVGHVILDVEPYDVDSMSKLTYKRHLLDEVRQITDGVYSSKIRKKVKSLGPNGSASWDEKPLVAWLKGNGKKEFGETGLEATGFEGFWDLATKGKFTVTNALGNEFINDKGFYPYVENLIRYYLKEDPILKNIETLPAAKFSLKGAVTLDKVALDRAVHHQEDFVIKGVTGRGGDAVWIGKKMSPAEYALVIEKVKKNPEYFIFQKYTPLSVMDGHIVDLRLITDVSGRGVISADVPWGRAIPLSGNGKVNLSDHGRETTVIVEREDCNEIMEGVSP